MRKIGTIAILISATFFSSQSVVAGELLSGEEIKNLFSGKTVAWASLKKKPMAPKWVPPYGSSYYEADGNILGIITFPNKTKNRSGKWHVADNMLCVNWKKEKCRNVERGDGEDYYLVNPNKGKRVVHVKKLTEGNQL